MTAGSGEEVSPDVISYYNSLPISSLNQIRNAGISDQRKALINNIISRRQAGLSNIPATTRGASAYAEARDVSEFQKQSTTQQQQAQYQQGGALSNVPVGNIQEIISQRGFVPESLFGAKSSTSYIPRGNIQETISQPGFTPQGAFEQNIFSSGTKVGTLPPASYRPTELKQVSQTRYSPGELAQQREAIENENFIAKMEGKQPIQISIPKDSAGKYFSSSPEAKRQAQERAERLRSFKFQKSDFIMRKEGGEPYLWGTLAKSFLSLGDIASAQLRLDKLFPNQPTINIETFSRIGSDFLKTSFFSPAFSTTAQIETKVLGLTKSGYAGISEQVTEKGFVTRTGYMSQRGKVSEKGVIASLSRVSAEEDKNLVLTLFKGQTYTRGVKFPTGKTLIKAGKQFQGIDLSLVKQQGEKFQSLSVGSFGRQGETSKFVSASLGEAEKDLTKAVGFTQAETGDVLSAGVIKNFPRKDMKEFVVSGKPVDLSTVIPSTQTFSRAMSIKVNEVLPPPSEVLSMSVLPEIKSIFPKAETKKASPILDTNKIQEQINTQINQVNKEIQKLNVRTKQVEIPKTKTLFGQNFGLSSSQSSAQRTKQLTKQKEEFAQARKQPQALRQELGLKSILRTTQLVRQVQSLKNIRALVTLPPQIPKSSKLLPLFIFPKGIGGKTKPKGYSISIRRFGKFKSIGTARDIQKALALGTKEARGTLGVTFKIEGADLRGLTTPKGFYKKESKKYGTLFIEKRGLRLKKGTGEIPEIQYFRKMRGRK